jgi:hypothetical protein
LCLICDELEGGVRVSGIGVDWILAMEVVM